PEAQAEVDELQGVRTTLAQLPDEPVERPILMLGEVERKSKTVVFGAWTRTLTSIAAVILLLITLAYFGKMQVIVADGGFTLAFNQPAAVEASDPEPRPAGMTEAQVDSLLQVRLAQQVMEQQDSLYQTLTSWNQKLTRQVAALRKEIPAEQPAVPAVQVGITQDEFYTTLRDLQEENVRLMMAIMETSNEDLKREFQQTLIQYAQFSDEQRTNDWLQLEQTLTTMQQETQVAQEKTDFLYNVLASATNEK
ncbi:MAG TPA: hypothetical protein DCR93_37190, partial [Cytophagales bacterium]|nr:hypothetical protein [Cytophagales bacterium]